MTATKQKKHKGRKGLLPAVSSATPKLKQQKHAALSPSTISIKNGVTKAAASAATPRSPGRPTAAKPAGAKAATIDKYTGKKKGTLFSAAPMPSKASAAFHRQKPPASVAAKLQSEHSCAKVAVAKATVRTSAQGTNGSSKQVSHATLGGSDASTQPAASKKKRHRRKGKGGEAHAAATADTAPQAAPPSNKGATGKSNWDRLKVHALAQSEAQAPKPQRTQSASHPHRKRKRSEHTQTAGVSSEWQAASLHGIVDGKLVPKTDDVSVTEVMALDCEMVGVGTSEGRKRDALARAALINDAGNVLMDVWVRPKEAVTDFRFHVTGIRWSDLKDGITPEEASRRMHELTCNATLVGHALHNDIKVLALQGTIPRHRVRDTALYPPLMGVREKSGKLFSRSLKNVAADELGISIQAGEHDPVQDARAALYLYHKHRQVWEMKVSTGLLHQPGGRTSAKLTKGFRKQKRMRVNVDAGVPVAPPPHAVQQLREGGGADGSDDEFAPPDALAVARMRSRLSGDAQDDHMADL